MTIFNNYLNIDLKKMGVTSDIKVGGGGGISRKWVIQDSLGLI